jgi:tripeptide aminopeptidase
MPGRDGQRESSVYHLLVIQAFQKHAPVEIRFMPVTTPLFNVEKAIERLLTFLAVPGITGEEKAVGTAVRQALIQAGVPSKAIRYDAANDSIPLPTQTGNLIVTLPGTVPGPRLLFMTHLDTVPLCAGAKPIRKGERIVPEGTTALGGDNRTGVACLVTMVATLLEKKLSYPPLTILFTVREESGLWGARFVKLEDLGNPVMGFNIDGGKASEITIGAVGAERWEAAVTGRAAHAGAHPEKGISATVAVSLALAEIYKGGWFGKIKKAAGEGTSNVGSIGDSSHGSAGQATNVVTDFALVRGEARSHDLRFVRAITKTYKEAFVEAAKKVGNDHGKFAKVRFQSRLDYYPFRLKPEAPVVKFAGQAAEAAGFSPTLRITNGGLDANWMVRHGVPTITFGAGQRNVHTLDEYVHLPDFVEGCRLALALAMQGAERQ